MNEHENEYRTETEFLRELIENPYAYHTAFLTGQTFEEKREYNKAFFYYRLANNLCCSGEDEMVLLKNLVDFIKAYQSKFDMTEFRAYVKDIILMAIGGEVYDIAAHMLYHAVSEKGTLMDDSLLIDEDIIILHIFTQISAEEKKEHLLPVLHHCRTWDQIKEHYKQFKFLLRRIQFSLPEYLQYEAVDFMNQYQISDFAAEKFVSYMGSEISQNIVTGLAHLKKISRPSKPAVPPVHSADPEHTFSFIINVSRKDYLSEIKHYIDNINIPDGYAVELVPVFDAVSMTSGYNRGMKKAAGKYKIYMHQDVFIVNPDILFEILRLFSLDENIGMMGVAGSTAISKNGMWWGAAAEDKYYNLHMDSKLYYDISVDEKIRGDYIRAEIIDGVMMITSKDIPWREDLFDGWHFYDASHSQEFKRRGYQVILPKISKIWVLHEDYYVQWNTNIYDYKKYGDIFLEEYTE